MSWCCFKSKPMGDDSGNIQQRVSSRNMNAPAKDCWHIGQMSPTSAWGVPLEIPALREEPVIPVVSVTPAAHWMHTQRVIPEPRRRKSRIHRLATIHPRALHMAPMSMAGPICSRAFNYTVNPQGAHRYVLRI